MFDSKDRRRRMVFEAVMCFGLPLVFMVLREYVLGSLCVLWLIMFTLRLYRSRSSVRYNRRHWLSTNRLCFYTSYFNLMVSPVATFCHYTDIRRWVAFNNDIFNLLTCLSLQSSPFIISTAVALFSFPISRIPNPD